MSVADSEPSQTRVQELEALVARMQSELVATSDRLAATSDRLAGVVSERDNLRRAYRQLMEQFELLRRRIFIAKAERLDASQLELEFEKTKQKLDALAKKLDGDSDANSATDAENAANEGETEHDKVGSRPSGKPPGKPKSPPKGRRNLAEADDLPQRRIEFRDPELEKNGATFIGWELSYKLGYPRRCRDGRHQDGWRRRDQRAAGAHRCAPLAR